ncbi:MAG TPA: NAD(+)/NADH kinase [Acidimicrobiales bacterium]
MAAIGFIAHSQREGAVNLAQQTAQWLRDQGHVAEFLDAASSTGVGRDGSDRKPFDLAVSLGGDGTMLRTVDLVSPDGVPVLGVNLGHLGYLTAVEPESLRDALRRFLDGDYQVESRMTLDVSVTNDGGDGAHTVLHRSALNDLVLQRPAGGHTVRTEVAVNGEPFLSFAADSLIVATPTGSTAYNLSARGPIVSPRARVSILTPVAPHMLFDRSLVLDADERISLSPIAGQPADMVVDGWLAATLHPGQTLHCRKGDRDALLVTFGARDFHEILKRKFNLADR